MRKKCPECEIVFVWTAGAPDPVFGELLPAPRCLNRAYCPVCLRKLWRTDHRWRHYPIHHRPPIEGPDWDTQVRRGLTRQLVGWPWRPRLLEEALS